MWVAPGRLGSQLSGFTLFELYGAEISDRRISSFRVVGTFAIVKHIRSGLSVCAIGFTCCLPSFRGNEKTLHGRVIPHIACATHAASSSLVCQQLLGTGACVLANFIGVMQ